MILLTKSTTFQENSKKLTDYREESTFSFDPGKLPLVLLEKGHHQSKSRSMRSRKHRNQAGRNQSQSDHANDFHSDHQGPLWALAQSEILKLRNKKPATGSAPQIADSSTGVENVDVPAVNNDPVVDQHENRNDDDDVPEMGFTLQITESRSQCGTDNKVSSVANSNIQSIVSSGTGSNAYCLFYHTIKPSKE